VVNERLQQARAMITAAQVSPLIGPLSSGLGEIYQFQLAGPHRSLMDLRTIMEWKAAPQLKQVPGVVDLNINGGDTETFEVRLNEPALIRYGINVGDVFAAVDANNVARGGACILHNQEQQVIVGRGLIRNLNDLGTTVLKTGPDGTPVYIRNVAELVKGARVRLGAVTRDGGGEIVNGVVLMLYGENSGVVLDGVKAELQKIQATLPKGVTIKPFYDRTELTTRTVHTVEHNLFEGAILVILVLLLMLGSWRAAVIVAAVIPLSLLVAMVGMHHFGISANLMSLGAIDFGMIVDGSVVLVENTLRRLRHWPPCCCPSGSRRATPGSYGTCAGPTCRCSPGRRRTHCSPRRSQSWCSRVRCWSRAASAASSSSNCRKAPSWSPRNACPASPCRRRSTT